MTYMCEECGHEDEKGGVHHGKPMIAVDDETPKDEAPHWECPNCGLIAHAAGTCPKCRVPMEEA